MSRRTDRDPDRSWLRMVFAIDLRSLALFRICLALLISFDLATRARFLVVHYTDQGLVPRFLVSGVISGSPLAFHFLSGSTAWEVFLFGLSAAFALMLLVGAYTRIATVGLWALMLSLFQRNPVNLNGGDALVVLLLFWSMFLPLGARWSIDAGRGRDARVLTPASAALLLQLALVYVFSGLAKNSPAWSDGSALNQALGQSLWVRPAGEWLREQETLSHFICYATRPFEVFAPLLLFSPVATHRLRFAAILAFLGFQLGLALCLELWLFPFYSSVGLAAFLPTCFWKWLERAAGRAREPQGGAAEPPLLARSRHARLADAAVVSALALGVADGVASQLGRELPLPIAQVAKILAIEQHWMMYGTMIDIDFRVRTRGALEDGSQIDFATERDGAFEPVRELLGDYRGKAYLQRFWGLEVAHQEVFARWLCRRWNGENPRRPRLVQLELDLALARLLPLGRRAPPIYQPLYRHACAEER